MWKRVIEWDPEEKKKWAATFFITGIFYSEFPAIDLIGAPVSINIHLGNINFFFSTFEEKNQFKFIIFVETRKTRNESIEFLQVLLKY